MQCWRSFFTCSLPRYSIFKATLCPKMSFYVIIYSELDSESEWASLPGLFTHIAAAVGYCSSCRLLLPLLLQHVQELATANAFGVTVPWVFKTYCCCAIAYKITRSRSIQVELGKVEGFRELWKGAERISSENCQPNNCKALSSLAACPE